MAAAEVSGLVFSAAAQRRFDPPITSSANSVRPLKMVATSIYIPKDDPEKPCGDDAHFIFAESKTVGVADGVGGWRKHGIDAGEYARRLMQNSLLALQENPHYAANPKRVLEEAYRHTAALGSSTACIVSLSGDNVIRAANVGDSGFLVVRDGAVFYRSPTQQRSFNYPYQLGLTKDDPSAAEEMEVRAESGDVVVIGTDGLFDNVHEWEMTEIVGQGKDLADECRYMANVALYNSLDRYRDTPFSMASRMAGMSYQGGKIDDITVVMAKID